MLVLLRLTNKTTLYPLKNNDRTNITIIMIAIVHSIYSQSVHALALNAWLMDNDAGRYCTHLLYIFFLLLLSPLYIFNAMLSYIFISAKNKLNCFVRTDFFSWLKLLSSF